MTPQLQDRIMAAICAAFDVTREELIGDSRQQRIADARQAFIALLCEHGISQVQAAKAVNRERSVGSISVAAARNKIETEQSFRSRYNLAWNSSYANNQ